MSREPIDLGCPQLEQIIGPRSINGLIVEGGHAPSVAAMAKAEGYDGAIIRNTLDGQVWSDIYVVFDPAQVEILSNREPCPAPTP